MTRESLLALPRTEVMGLAIFGLILVAFMVSGGLSWWKDRKQIKK